MVAQAAKDTHASSSPLDRLAKMLDSDMQAVNAAILDHMQSNVPMIPKLAAYLIAAGGKRIRPLLTLACTRLYDTKTSRPFALAASVEFIHTATLLHDDVVDGSEERRGKKAANLVFGNDASVLVGDFLFSRAFQLMVADGSLDVLRILSDASAIISQGEVMQLTTAGNIATSMEEYEEIIKAKTAALFASACEIGPVIAGADKSAASAMCEYGLNLGMAFQIVDDILDYNADHDKLGKTLGDDFREGKMTAPVILALAEATNEERDFWQRTLAEKKQEDGDFVQACAILKRHGAIEKGLKLAQSYAEKARLALSEAPDGRLRSLLDELVSFTVERSH